MSTLFEFEEFLPGQLIRSEQFNLLVQALKTSFGTVEVANTNFITLPDGLDSVIDEPLMQRRLRVIGFDELGNLQLRASFEYVGDYVPTTAYLHNQIFRDPASKNLYAVKTSYTAVDIATDLGLGNIVLALNVEDVELAKNAALLAQSAAELAAVNAETSAINASGAAIDAENSALNSAASASSSAISASDSAVSAANSENSAIRSELAAIAAEQSNANAELNFGVNIRNDQQNSPETFRVLIIQQNSVGKQEEVFTTAALTFHPETQTFTSANFEGNGFLLFNLNADSIIFGTVSPEVGGTGLNAVGEAGSVAFSNGVRFGFTAAGAPGQVLTATGAGAPVWADAGTGSGGGGDPTAEADRAAAEADAAALSADSALTSQNAAAASASAALTSANNAADSEANALTSELNSQASAASALTSETNALTQADRAQTEADRAEAAADSINSTSSMPTGGGTDAAFFLNDQSINTSYAIPAGKNALSAGPIAINNGATVSVPVGSTWTIVGNNN